ncbi:MAG: hypothetical protein KH233_01520 [Haemophilus parainfluenzae]|nr:hypothetical protein [Haemophilus parainfluenzae]
MSRLTEFSSATSANLSRDAKRKYYVYCLIANDEIFYVGKGCGNRVFAHEAYAKGIIKNFNQDDIEGLDKLYSSQPKIKKIIQSEKNIQRFIVNYFLTESEAFACENTLINFLQAVKNIDLTNLVSGHGVSALTVEQLDKALGFEKTSLEKVKSSLPDIKKDDLILAVKIKDSFKLSNDEDNAYVGTDRDDNNLKSRTLGVWVVGEKAASNIKYVIGVNTGADNAVVSAYKVKSYHSIQCKERNGKD